MAHVRLASRARQWLNRHPQFLAEIGGQHGPLRPPAFRARGRAGAAGHARLAAHLRLQLDFADLLPDFHVVVPSFPGFAFSTPYADGPVTEVRLAATMHALMTEVLGYDAYLTYGEDVSANVNDLIAATRIPTRGRRHRDALPLPVDG